MGKIAFVFAGQGAQYPGMGKEICESSSAAAEIFKISDGIRANTSKQCFEGSQEELNRTVNTQPCVYTVDLACACALKEAGVVPDAVAGFSLGEIAALTFAGIFDEKEGFEFVTKRGELMDKAAQKVDGAMVAVMKMSPDEVKALAEEMGVYAVNFNSPQQTVVAGEKSLIKEFTKELKARKALGVPLKVSGAFHTPYMQSATEGMAAILAEMNIGKAKLPVYANMTASLYPEDKEGIVSTVSNQASNPVRWSQIIQNMAEEGFDTFYEVGPGKTLTGLIAKIAPEVKVFNIENEEDIKNVGK